MYVDKETAKKMIDQAQGLIWIDTIDMVTYVHTKPAKINKTESKRIIRKASEIDYEDNDFFLRLSLCGVDGVQESLVHNLSFPQIRMG